MKRTFLIRQKNCHATTNCLYGRAGSPDAILIPDGTKGTPLQPDITSAELNAYSTSSVSKYENPAISPISDADKFHAGPKTHQQGQSDYFTFSRQCADTGIDKWMVTLGKMTCTYYDAAGNEVITEIIPG